MRFDVDRCPSCGGEAEWLAEAMLTERLIQRGPDGEYAYVEEGDLDSCYRDFPETEEPVRFASGLFEVRCADCGEHWETSGDVTDAPWCFQPTPGESGAPVRSSPSIARDSEA